MRSTKKLMLLALSASLLGGGYAAAQTPLPKPVIPAPRLSNWPYPDNLENSDRVDVVTVAEPTKRQACHVKAYEADQIECAAHGLAPAKTYQREDVMALIVPGKRPLPPWVTLLTRGGSGAGAITAAVFLGSVSMVAAVPAAIVGTVLVFMSVEGFFDQYSTPDRVVYLKPDAVLQVAMR